MYIKNFLSSNVFTSRIRRAVYIISSIQGEKNYLIQKLKFSPEEANIIAEIDPTQEKKYMRWIGNLINKDRSKLYDNYFKERVRYFLKLYNEASRKKETGLSKSIYDYKSIEQLEEALNDYASYLKPILTPPETRVDIKPFKIYSGKEVGDEDPESKWKVYLIDNYAKSRELCKDKGFCVKDLPFYLDYSERGFISLYYITRNNELIALATPNSEIEGPFNQQVQKKYIDQVSYILKDLGIPINFGGFNIKVSPKSTEELINLYKKNPNINYLIKKNPELASDELLEKFIKDYYNSYGKLPDLPDNVNKDIVNKIKNILEDIKNTKDTGKSLEHGIGLNYILKNLLGLGIDDVIEILKQVKYLDEETTIKLLEKYKNIPEIVNEIISKGTLDDRVVERIPLNPTIIGAIIHANVMSDTLLDRIEEEYIDNPKFKDAVFNTAAKELRNPILINYIEDISDDKAVRTFIKNNLELLIEMPSISVSNRSIERIKEALGENSPMYKLVHLRLRPREKIDVTNLDIDKVPENILYILYNYQTLSPEQIDKAIEKGEYLDDLYEHQKLSPEQIDKAIEKGEELYYLYRYQKLSPEQIDKAIEKGKELSNLHRYQKLSPEQIDKAIEKGKDLDTLYYHQKLSPEQIDKAIDKGKELYVLYEHQKLSPEQINKAIEEGKDLDILYEYQKLSPENIDKAIEKGEELYSLYQYQELSPENIDKAIEKGEDLYSLYQKVNLTSEQINKAIDKGDYLYIIYHYQKLFPENIDKAIEKGKDLDALHKYEENNMTPEQLLRLREKLTKKSYITNFLNRITYNFILP